MAKLDLLGGRTVEDAAKVPRAQQQTNRLARGDVYLPIAAPWLNLFMAEILAFPRGRNDDMVDAFVQGLRLLDLGSRDLKYTRYCEYLREQRERIRGGDTGCLTCWSRSEPRSPTSSRQFSINSPEYCGVFKMSYVQGTLP